ncbi:chorismate-binding protein [Thermoleptolyngbya sichuanensis A183]|uniref:Chromophore lyase CpcT/CpeT n=2 Tax=Thermoleptolyngbya TaxID=2303528 RepID=A0A6M8BQ20_9CYAN|nr:MULTISPECIES: chromophore lyase CpcT/CpeT [Thermoleptolyngbya]MDG2614752.1 chromophore lyase CpcT/CpeT [Thermoleptolyngbya sichuanensis XZ-Cy5]QKD84415.1 chorismate-binding protein [Thermoleptolyngbya sichuanensis A183]WOB42926.1 chorismate-binding protein [Thermoleptolyngbya oregonensis NK1-22]HIK42355.1 chromophore lyase CpcT/CpeT [Thermoleptolyngbya sp. M55_K2018_002]
MTHSTDLTALARWMAADFSNQEQAFENPPFFAHIRVCMRPLPVELLSGISLFVEQAYDYALNDPYRLRVLKLVNAGDHIEIENYTVKDETEFYGASRDLTQLSKLTGDRLEKLPGCNMIVEWTGHSFRGKVEPGKGCMVTRRGKETYLDSEFEIDDQIFISLDRGRDPETDEHIWGSVAGPFHFVRWASFADEIRA